MDDEMNNNDPMFGYFPIPPQPTPIPKQIEDTIYAIIRSGCDNLHATLRAALDKYPREAVDSVYESLDKRGLELMIRRTSNHDSWGFPGAPAPRIYCRGNYERCKLKEPRLPYYDELIKPKEKTIQEQIAEEEEKAKYRPARDQYGNIIDSIMGSRSQISSTLNKFQMASQLPEAQAFLNRGEPSKNSKNLPEGYKKFKSPLNTDKGMEPEEKKPKLEENPRLKNIEPKLLEMIRNEILDNSGPIDFDDISGLEYVKVLIKEAIILPILRPDIFTGLRAPPKGILMFGPPGTGKTLLGKCIAAKTKATFFSISSSSLTSKWMGEGEKLVRALFALATVMQPSVIFIDEIDSMLTQRSEDEHESTRRIKTEFLVQLDGVNTDTLAQVLVIGATNRPQELDEAARRRFTKRLYVGLPDEFTRYIMIEKLMKEEKHSLTQNQLLELGKLTCGYTGADIKTVCHEAAMFPIREIPFDQMATVSHGELRPMSMEDFQKALAGVRPSVNTNDISAYIDWNSEYGYGNPANMGSY